MIVAAALLLASTTMFVLALREGLDKGLDIGGPTVAPVIVTGLWTAVSVTYLIGQWRKADEREKPRWRVSFALLALLVVYALVLKYTVVGYVLATSVFTVATARVLSSRPWREVIIRDVCVGIGLALGIYLTFTRVLGIVLPAGVLPL